MPLVAWMADRVGAAEDRVQVAGGEASVDDVVAGSEAAELLSRDDAVPARGEFRDPPTNR